MFKKLENVSELLTVRSADVVLSSNQSHIWSFSELNVTISECELDLLDITVKKAHTADQLQILIYNSSFGSLDLQSGTAGIISDCYINANNSKRPTLITANNSNVFITNSVFKQFVTENGPSLLHGHSSCIINISGSMFINHNALHGVVDLGKGCSLTMNDSSMIGNLASSEEYSAFTSKEAKSLIIQHSLFVNYSAFIAGAMISSHHTTIHIDETTFIDNSATTGGAIKLMNQVELNISSCFFEENSSKYGSGGAVFGSENVRLEIHESTFSENKAFISGGAIRVRNETELLVSYCQFSDNNAQQHGGAIAGDTSVVLQIYYTNFSGNSADKGGAILLYRNSNLTVSLCLFERDSASSYGGAIRGSVDTKVYLDGTIFMTNRAVIGGGAVSIYQDTILLVSRCQFTDNGAFFKAGAIRGREKVTLEIDNSYFTGNSARLFDSGAINVKQNSNLTVSLCLFERNSAGSHGGAIKGLLDTNVYIGETRFIDNAASKDGGAIKVKENSNLTVSLCLFERNSAGSFGGAIVGYQNVKINIYQSNLTRNLGSGTIAVQNGSLQVQESSFVASNGSFGAIAILYGRIIKITRCVFEDNFASYISGAVMAGESVELNIEACKFIRNKAAFSGGAVVIGLVVSVRITRCTFIGNKALGNKGVGGAVAIHKSGFIDNAASKAGGAINVKENSNLTASLCLFERNSAGSFGGAVEGVVYMYETIFIRNRVKYGGGAVSIYQDTILLVSHCQFKDNSAKLGGAIRGRVKVIVEIYNSNFTGNNATSEDGGAINVQQNSNLTVSLCLFERNSAGSHGGAIVGLLDTNLYIGETRFIDNAASKAGGAINVKENSNLTASLCLFERNSAGSFGGAVEGVVNANVYIDETIFIRNRAEYGGGAVSIYQDTILLLSHCQLTDNSTKLGGAIRGRVKVIVEIYNSNFTGNKATKEYGGAIYVFENSNLTVSLCLLKRNSAGSSGGAVMGIIDTNVYIGETRFIENRASRDGGAFNVQQNSNLTVSLCLFERNSAGSVGGAVMGIFYTKVHIDETRFIDNRANTGGATAIHKETFLLVSYCHFGDNSAKLGGGAIIGMKNVTLEIHGTNFTENNAKSKHGGAINVQQNSSLTISLCLFERNSAGSSGGAIMGSVNIKVSTEEIKFIGNRAKYGGATAVSKESILLVSDCQFRDNTAKLSGGVIVSKGAGSTVEINNSTFVRNNASANGGAVMLDVRSPSNYLICFYQDDNVPVSVFCKIVNSKHENTKEAEESHSELNLTDCLLEENYATESGGAITVRTKMLVKLHNTKFIKNKSLGTGGAMSLDGLRNVEVIACFIINNTANTAGAIYLHNTNLANIQDVNFIRNNALVDGGAMYVLNKIKMTLRSCLFSQNYAAKYGGALAGKTNTKLYSYGTNFIENSASFGGGLHVKDNSSIYLHYTNFTENIATWDGGGMAFSINVTVNVRNCTLQSNKANHGGGISIDSSTNFTFNHASLLQNHAKDKGGAIDINTGQFVKVTLRNSKCIRNQAGSHGGCLSMSNDACVHINNILFEENEADKVGGAISSVHSTFQVSGNIMHVHNIRWATNVW